MSTTLARIQLLQSITGRTRTSLRLTMYVLTIVLQTQLNDFKFNHTMGCDLSFFNKALHLSQLE